MSVTNNLRNLLNDNYYHIRPILVEAVNSAIRAMENNGEEEVEHMRTLIIRFSSDVHNDAEAIDNYLSSVNINSSTRQFFERFVIAAAEPQG